MSAELTDHEYDERKKVFEAWRDTLPKEPTGDVKKEYSVGCFQESDWQFIHAELIKNGSLESNIPTNECECVNDCLQSPVRGHYLLTDTEAAELRANPKVNYVQVNATAYPGTYAPNPDDLTYARTYRYSSTVKNQQDTEYEPGAGGTGDSNDTINPYVFAGQNLPGAQLLNRCTAQLLRHTQKRNPWVVLGDAKTIIDDRLYHYGTGKDVDLIVCDDHCWFGHIEFQNPNRITNVKQEDGTAAIGVSGPSDYIGGNVLDSGYSASSTNGTCDVLDVVLDAPYYIDPAWFEADIANRLTTRWDGTTVPVESVAREWWFDSNKRSSQFASAGTVVPSAVADYTRLKSNGVLTDAGGGGPTEGWFAHGTPCASQAYGRSYGWAYNANKWYINLFGDGGVLFEACFDIVKIFHQNKPNRSSDNTKNPTITSNSWGRRFNPAGAGDFLPGGGGQGQYPGYYWYRPATIDGTTSGVLFRNWDVDGNTDGANNNSVPRFMSNRIGPGQQIQCTPVSGATFTAYEEMNAAGVLFVCAAGNHNQKCVKSTHPDYNNYVDFNNNVALSATQFTVGSDNQNYIRTINRGGFPSAYNEAIVVGALTGALNSSGQEQKANYSSMGDLVTCWATSGGLILGQRSAYLTNAASKLSQPNSQAYHARYDSTYTVGSTQSLTCDDKGFNGTSSACPIACGLIATKLETNRDWTFSDIESWLNGLGTQSQQDFYYGVESTTENDTTWTDNRSLQGGSALVIYDGPTTGGGLSDVSVEISGDLTFSGAFTLSET